MPSGRLEQHCGRQSRDREGEEKHDGSSTCTEEGALPRCEGGLEYDDEGSGTPHVASTRLKRLELRGPEPDSNPYRHRRHPNDVREDAAHRSMLAWPYSHREPLQVLVHAAESEIVMHGMHEMGA
jgi:hypothetical protein